MFLTDFSLLSVLLLFPLTIKNHPRGWFLMLFHLTQTTLFRSANLLMCLSLETFTTIIGPSKLILVELIDPIKLCYNFFYLKSTYSDG